MIVLPANCKKSENNSMSTNSFIYLFTNTFKIINYEKETYDGSSALRCFVAGSLRGKQ